MCAAACIRGSGDAGMQGTVKLLGSDPRSAAGLLLVACLWLTGGLFIVGFSGADLGCARLPVYVTQH